MRGLGKARQKAADCRGIAELFFYCSTGTIVRYEYSRVAGETLTVLIENICDCTSKLILVADAKRPNSKTFLWLNVRVRTILSCGTSQS